VGCTRCARLCARARSSNSTQECAWPLRCMCACRDAHAGGPLGGLKQWLRRNTQALSNMQSQHTTSHPCAAPESCTHPVQRAKVKQGTNQHAATSQARKPLSSASRIQHTHTPTYHIIKTATDRHKQTLARSCKPCGDRVASQCSLITHVPWKAASHGACCCCVTSGTSLQLLPRCLTPAAAAALAASAVQANSRHMRVACAAAAQPRAAAHRAPHAPHPAARTKCGPLASTRSHP
jgi:hypothetical protein